jgi:hypothetical protein
MLPCVQAIPPTLGSLRQLKTLQLDNNRIRAIPPTILAECTSLQTLSLHGNPITAQVGAGDAPAACVQGSARRSFAKLHNQLHN